MSPQDLHLYLCRLGPTQGQKFEGVGWVLGLKSACYSHAKLCALLLAGELFLIHLKLPYDQTSTFVFFICF